MAKDVHLKVKGDASQVKVSFGQAKEAVKKEVKAMAKDADKSSKDISAAYKKMGIRTDEAIRKSTQEAKKNFNLIKKSGTASANEIKKAHIAMTEKIKRNNAEMRGGASKLGKAWGALKGKIAGIGAALAIFGTVKTIKIAADYDLELQKVINVLGDFNDDTRKILEDNASIFRKQYGLGAELFLQGTLNAIQSSITALDESKKLQEAAGKLTVVLKDEMGTAFALLPDLIKGFNKEADDSEEILGRILGIMRAGGPNLKDFANQTGKLTASTVAANQEMETLFSILDAAADLKFDPRGLLGGVKTFMDVIQRAPSTLGEFEDVARAVFRNAEGEIRPLIDIINDLAGVIDEVGAEKGDVVLYRLGLTGASNILVKRFALEIDKVNEAFNRTIDGQTILNEAYTETTKRAGFLFKQITQGFQDMFVQMGMAFISNEGFIDSINKIKDTVIKSVPIIIFAVKQIVGQFQNLLDVVTFIPDKIKWIYDKSKNLFGLANIEAGLEKIVDTSKEAVKGNRELERSEKKLSKTLRDAVKDVLKDKEALKEEKKKAIELLEEEKKTIEANLKVELAAIDKRKTELKKANIATRKELKETQKKIDDLKSEIDKFEGFAESIEDARKDIGREKAIGAIVGGPLGKPLAEIEVRLVFIKEDFEAAMKELAKGTGEGADAFLKLAEKARDAALEIEEIEPKAEGIIGKQGEEALAKAQAQASGVLDKLKEAGEKAAEIKDADLEAEQAKASKLEEDLAGGERALDNIKTEIGDAKQLAQDMKDKLNEAVKSGTLQAILDEVGDANEAAQILKDKLNEDTASTHTTTFKEVQAKAEGGFVQPVKARAGRRIPGYGGGDKIHVIAEKGEYIWNKEATRLNFDFIDAANRMGRMGLAARMPVERIQEAQKLAAGGQVQGQGQELDRVGLDLSYNGTTLKTTASRDPAKEFIKNIKRANIIHGRRKPTY